MSFRPMLRPGQGFKPFKVIKRCGGKTETGRPKTKHLEHMSTFYGIISQASPKEIEQWKQLGTPISHTIVQRGTSGRAMATDVLELVPPVSCCENVVSRRFLVQGEPQDPGELGHFLIYRVEERADLQ